MQTQQIQLKISLSPRLDSLLKKKAQSLGVPVTQFVKHTLLKELEEEYPTFEASDRLERKTKKAMKEIDKAVWVDDIDEFFKKL